jgi:hypothetical protein
MAVSLTETDVFQYYETSGARMSARMKALITNPNAATVVNEKLEMTTLGRFGTTFKEPIALKALIAVRNGDLVLFVAKPEYNLPECMPYFRYTMKGHSKVAVNLTNICTIEEDPEDPTNTSYQVDDMRKLYAVLVGAYLNLKIPDPATYPVKSIEYGAMMWARMFCKVLNRTIGLSTNRDRYEAYFYFAARFYLSYLIGAPEATVDSISLALLKGGVKSPLISMIEEKVASESINMNESFTTFCQTLFNNDISGVKGMRMVSANPNEKLNASFFLRRFVDTYNQSAIMSLASAQYFTWMVICTQKKAYMCNIKMLGDVFDGVEGSKYLAALYSDATM